MKINPFDSPPFEARSLQRHVAFCAIAPTTLRGKGNERRAICEWLGKEADLSALQNHFPDILDQWTSEISRKGWASWGVARKAVNLFIRSSSHNCWLRSAYGLEAIEKIFEIPLDKQTMGCIRTEKLTPNGSLKATTIKALCSDLSAAYQREAQLIANDKRTLRVHLDVLFWNPERRTSFSA